MKNMEKRFLAILVVIVCLFSVTTNAFASETVVVQEDVKNYYEAQLTEEQHLYYQEFEKHYIGEDGLPITTDGEITIKRSDMPTHKSEEELQQFVSTYGVEIQRAYLAFVFDYPQVFWTNSFQWAYAYQYGEWGYKIVRIVLYMNNEIQLTQEQLLDYNAGIKSVTEEISALLPQDAQAYDYYKAVHTWVCEDITYNHDALINMDEHSEAFTSYPVFATNGDSLVVCEGYGETYKILCDQLELKRDIELECVLIMGVGITERGQENHLWNAVLMSDENWYGIDTTWDDQNDAIHYEYFLCGKTTLGLIGHDFENDHIEREQITSSISVEYPEIARYAYGEEQIYDWEYRDGVLRIGGEGPLPSYLAAEGAPWYEHRNEITSVIIGNGITRIPEGLLRYYQKIESLSIPFVGATADSDGDEKGLFGYIFGRTSDASKVLQFFPVGNGYVSYSYFEIPTSLESVKITNDITISAGAFSNAVLTNQGIMGNKENNHIRSIQVNCAVNAIGDYAFSGVENAVVYGFNNSYLQNYCGRVSVKYVNLDPNRIDYIEVNDGKDFEVFIGDTVDLSTIPVKIYYADGRYEVATTGIVFGTCDFSTVGEKIVTVSCKGKESQLKVIVSYKSGDLNGDGMIDAKDIVRMKKILAHETQEECATPDLNASGAIDFEDIMMLKRFLIGLIRNFASKV